MAKRKSTDHIPPFPDSIDRDYFGAWLSGFVDGEGCFYLHYCTANKQHQAGFAIQLRADDQQVLQLIRSYLQSGRFFHRLSQSEHQKPRIGYIISDIEALHNVVVPHFIKYPLFAKKTRDFSIWRQGVELAYRVHKRPMKRPPTNRGGSFPKWGEDDHEQFCALIADLKQQRRYRPAPIASPVPQCFPAEINRDYFGAWLSGFTDGEGCFHLRHYDKHPGHYRFFGITLRADDLPVLQMIQGYFQCGVFMRDRGRTTPGQKPTVTYRIFDLPSLLDIVVPHFVRYPLLAKKSKDFPLWREGVELCYRIHKRKYTPLLVGKGVYPKWTDDEREQFRDLALALKQQRQYQSPRIAMPPPPQSKKVPGLFDHLGDNEFFQH